MNKTGLQSKWGKYCDTYKLVDDVRILLTKYHHRNTEEGVCAMLDTYFTNKKDLIELFKKSPNYKGDMRIVFDIELERENNVADIRSFCAAFIKQVNAGQAILKYVDEDGKRQSDYLKTGIMKLTVNDLLSEDTVKTLKKNNGNLSKFQPGGETVESATNFKTFSTLMNRYFYYIHTPTVDESSARNMMSVNADCRIASGMKTSRAFNRVCALYGVDKMPKYNKLFATYADMVSGLKRRLKFFMSVNPLDYLTMSFGVSWSSCHTIDKRNQRGVGGGYQGQYCGGTVSYMLDSTSLVTYVHNSVPDDVEEGKLYRCMFHYDNGTLIQGRVYPQGNDGSSDLYKTFRGFVQKELSDMLGKANRWTKSSDRCSSHTRTLGVQYQDYCYFDNCNMSYLNEIYGSDDGVVHIGHDRICPKCGGIISDSASASIIVHGTCPI